jgi:hypothetical protein
MLRHISIVFLFAFAVANAAPIQDRSVRPAITKLPVSDKRYALVIGVENYGPDITSIKGPVKDANTLEGVLSQYGGFPPEHVYVLASDRDIRHRPTRENILFYLADLKSRVPSDGLMLVFFSGHGMERAGEAFLLPEGIHMSTDLQYLEDQAISVDRLKRGLDAIAAQQALVLIDACRDDPEQSKGVSPNLMSQAYVAPFDTLNHGIAASAVIYATAPGERAYISPTRMQGYFTMAVVDAFKSVDDPTAPALTLARLVSYLQRVVPSQVQQDFGPSRKQEPYVRIDGFQAEKLVLALPRVVPLPPGPSPLPPGPSRPVPNSVNSFVPVSPDVLGPKPSFGLEMTSWLNCHDGNPSACFLLGYYYESGVGFLPKDLKRAVGLFKQACDEGNATGCFKLGDHYLDGTGGLPKDLSRAVALFTQACDRGGADGCERLGRRYEPFGGLPQDYARAFALFKQACDGGSAEGCNDLGAAYEFGPGGLPKDLARALELYKKACDGSSAMGCVNLKRLKGGPEI